MRERFSPIQRSTLLLCFFAYASAYTGRLNLSAAIPGLRGGIAMSDAQAGLFQTVFALVYAAGQIVNGSLIDKINVRRSIAVGLIISAGCNALFGLTDSFPVMLILWGLNGAAQSMLWTPIVKLVADRFSGQARDRASFVLSITIIFGHFIAWAISGTLAAILNWRYSFLIPAFIMTAAGVFVFAALRREPVSGADAKAISAPPAPMPLGKLISRTGLAALLLCCVCNGFVRDGVVTWAPTVLSSGSRGMSLSSTLLSLIIPPLNILGIVLVRRCYRLLRGNARGAVGVLLLVSALMAWLLRFTSAPAACALLLGLCCASCYGINPMINTLIPMEYERAGRVGLVAGLVDCFIYLGSALAGTAAGALSDSYGWGTAYAVWALVSSLGAVLAFVSIRGGKRMAQMVEHL